MANSLLAHMYSRIRGSQEDVATIALQYLVSQSTELNCAFTHLLEAKLGVTIANNLQYTCQAVGDDKERPDMAGTDQKGNEVVLCEMKFYAGLTQNQPLSYLNRLKERHGIGLVFVCPKARQTSLWAKLKELCIDQHIEPVSDYCLCVNNIRLAIMTWTEVVDALHSIAVSTSSVYLSDIHQLSGFCAQMDSEAFIPFSPDELTADNAIQMERYYSVIDETAKVLCANTEISCTTKGKSNSYRSGYERKVELEGITVRITFDRELWKCNSSFETPFWVEFGDGDFQRSSGFQKCLSAIADNKKENSVWSLTYFSLDALTDATFDEVCKDLMRQILDYLSLVRSYLPD